MRCKANHPQITVALVRGATPKGVITLMAVDEGEDGDATLTRVEMIREITGTRIKCHLQTDFLGIKERSVLKNSQHKKEKRSNEVNTSTPKPIDFANLTETQKQGLALLCQAVVSGTQ